MKRNETRLPAVANTAKRRTGDEFAFECEKWEEASDEEDDYPYKQWVASLARRTLQPPIRTCREMASVTWLEQKESMQKMQWPENSRNERLFLPAVTVSGPAPQREGLHLLGASRRLQQQKFVTRHKRPPWRFLGDARGADAAETVEPEPAEADEHVPLGWGMLKDYVHGVKIGPGSLFSHSWDRPTPSGIHPNPPRSRRRLPPRHTIHTFS
mmetsp:Transcript_22560/g.42515  ORF Transcript_22560/g.42515 Transcript_22560/m.42515 type:complete len:212 (+) Transcript_22560:59-694(+)